MRGADKRQDWVFSYISAKNRVPTEHSLRPIGAVADTVLKDLSLLFESPYAEMGRPVAQSRAARIRAAQDRAAQIRAAQLRAAQVRDAQVPAD